jgi:hypothetical protein
MAVLLGLRLLLRPRLWLDALRPGLRIPKLGQSPLDLRIAPQAVQLGVRVDASGYLGVGQ